MFVYIGSRTTKERNACGEGISICEFDPNSGHLNRLSVVKDLVNPSYLAISHNQKYLYSIHGDSNYVSAFKIDAELGELTLLDHLHCGGRNPVHLAINSDDTFLVISNHLTGNVVSIALNQDGTFDRIKSNQNLPGQPGPHRKEQPFSKPHYNSFDKSGQFIIVPDKGLDKIFSFSFEDGALTLVSDIKTREGAGPRHYVQHPKLNKVYVVNELDSTVVTYNFDEVSGLLEPTQVLSTLADNFVGNSRAASIISDLKGRYIYTSNRGSDSISQFKVDDETGKLSFISSFNTAGKTPRCIALSPDGSFLFSLNEDSHNISIFNVDHKSGALQLAHIEENFGSPVNIEFLNI